MRNIDPALDYSAYSDEREAQSENANYVLFIDDVVGLSVDGAKYEVWIDASLVRHGESGPIEINAADLKEIFMHVPGFEEPIQIKEKSFYVSHHRAYQRLENAVDLYLLQKAAISEKWEMENV